MGIEVTQTTICTCDICGNACGKNDGEIQITVNGGDGRDVGPAAINGKLSLYQPYKCSAGIVCRKCKIEWLGRYVDQQRGTQGQQS